MAKVHPEYYMSDIARPDFDEMPIAQLREYASHMQIPLAKTAKKEDIKEAIMQKLAGKSAAFVATKGDRVPPGHAKIIINEDTNPTSRQIPVLIFCNGYKCTIPRGKEVIVPMRVVRTLQDSKTKRPVHKSTQDQYGREVFVQTTVTVPSYPFQVLEMNPGPEPLTNTEKSKKLTEGPRQRYKKQFGRYPKPADLRRAIERGLIKIKDDEILPSEISSMIEDDNTEE